MPLIPEGDLLQALYFEIDRQTPFEPEHVYFDYRIVQRRPEAKRLSVELTVIPKLAVEPILRQVQQWGFQPSIVDVASGRTNDGIGINLLRGLEQSSANTRWPVLRWASVFIFLLLIIAVVYLPILQLKDADELLTVKVTQASERAKQTLAKREELEQTARIARFLDERKEETPRALLILEELTKALPDNTWLTSLSQKKDQIKISGYSARAAELISLIDAVPLLKNPSFSSPIVQDPQNKQERFDISFEIETNGAAK
jgi:general secretion pathway protein L